MANDYFSLGGSVHSWYRMYRPSKMLGFLFCFLIVFIILKIMCACLCVDMCTSARARGGGRPGSPGVEPEAVMCYLMALCWLVHSAQGVEFLIMLFSK